MYSGVNIVGDDINNKETCESMVNPQKDAAHKNNPSNSEALDWIGVMSLVIFVFSLFVFLILHYSTEFAKGVDLTITTVSLITLLVTLPIRGREEESQSFYPCLEKTTNNRHKNIF